MELNDIALDGHRLMRIQGFWGTASHDRDTRSPYEAVRTAMRHAKEGAKLSMRERLDKPKLKFDQLGRPVGFAAEIGRAIVHLLDLLHGHRYDPQQVLMSVISEDRIPEHQRLTAGPYSRAHHRGSYAARRFSAEDRREIVKLGRRGESRRITAAKFETSARVIRNIQEQHGVKAHV